MLLTLAGGCWGAAVTIWKESSLGFVTPEVSRNPWPVVLSLEVSWCPGWGACRLAWLQDTRAGEEGAGVWGVGRAVFPLPWSVVRASSVHRLFLYLHNYDCASTTMMCGGSCPNVYRRTELSWSTWGIREWAMEIPWLSLHRTGSWTPSLDWNPRLNLSPTERCFNSVTDTKFLFLVQKSHFSFEWKLLQTK